MIYISKHMIDGKVGLSHISQWSADNDSARDGLISAFELIPLLNVSKEQQIANLDQVRAVIIDNELRLEMDYWHDSDDWETRTIAEEMACNTAHCLAGWLQIFAPIELRQLPAALAGEIQAPVAAKMFYSDEGTVYNWLESRAYVEELK